MVLWKEMKSVIMDLATATMLQMLAEETASVLLVVMA